MPTHITQVDDADSGAVLFRIEGQLMHNDALLLSRITRQLADDGDRKISIDLADVDFIDSDAASILKELETWDGFELVGVEILLQNAINEAERHDT